MVLLFKHALFLSCVLLSSSSILLFTQYLAFLRSHNQNQKSCYHQRFWKYYFHDLVMLAFLVLGFKIYFLQWCLHFEALKKPFTLHIYVLNWEDDCWSFSSSSDCQLLNFGIGQYFLRTWVIDTDIDSEILNSPQILFQLPLRRSFVRICSSPPTRPCCCC